MHCLHSPIPSSPHVFEAVTIIMTHPQMKKPLFRETGWSWSPAAEPGPEAHIPVAWATLGCWPPQCFPQEKTVCN